MANEAASPSLFNKEELICFPDGLFGFEQYKDFLPLLVEEDNDALLWLQSTDDEALSFVIMNPFYLMPEYEPVLSAQDYDRLGTRDSDQISFYVICVADKSPENSTVNLKCPIAVNTVSREAFQVILEAEKYQMRHALNDFHN